MNSASLATSTEKNCLYCNLSMPIQANVCSKCNRDQRWYFNYLRIGDILLLVSLLISFGMMYLSYSNFQVAKIERDKASEALRRASAAEDKVTAGMQHLQHDIENRSEDVRRIESRVKEVVIEISKTKNELKGINKRVEKESDRVARVERDQEESTLVKIIKHGKSSELSEDALRGQIHQIMGPYTLTLPPAKVGLSGTFSAGVEGVFSLKAGRNDRIILHGVPLPTGNKITSMGVIEAKISLVCISDNVWDSLGETAIFADGGI